VAKGRRGDAERRDAGRRDAVTRRNGTPLRVAHSPLRPCLRLLIPSSPFSPVADLRAA